LLQKISPGIVVYKATTAWYLILMQAQLMFSIQVKQINFIS